MLQSIQILISNLLTIACKAGNSILDVYNADIDVTFKNDRSPLTIADKNSNEIIVNLLSTQTYSHFSVLSEEGRDIPYLKRKSWEYFWLVDPLDGTKEFIKRNGEFTVNIALIHKERPVLGVIYIPVRDIFYFAADGLGAYKLQNSEALEIFSKESRDKGELLQKIINNSTKLLFSHSTIKPINHINIIGSSSHATREQENFVEEMKKKFSIVDFISAGSSLKFCLIAEGLADIYPRFGPTMEWDTAAGQIIVEQAGGKVLSMKTKEALRYNKENLLNPWFIALNKNHLLEQKISYLI
jgi:3'(2'), 5'-bisphosphate nucleotidase